MLSGAILQWEVELAYRYMALFGSLQRRLSLLCRRYAHKFDVVGSYELM